MGREETEDTNENHPLTLVGRFLIDEAIRVRAMKDRMADVWRPRREALSSSSSTP